MGVGATKLKLTEAIVVPFGDYNLLFNLNPIIESNVRAILDWNTL